jgi:hypothetical protein
MGLGYNMGDIFTNSPGAYPAKSYKIGLQIFVTCPFYILVAFNQNSLVGQVFCNYVEPFF